MSIFSSVSLKSAIGLSCLSIITLSCIPWRASNRRVGRRPEVPAGRAGMAAEVWLFVISRRLKIRPPETVALSLRACALGYLNHMAGKFGKLNNKVQKVHKVSRD